jgi:FkbM family methyltransferase
MGIGKILYQDLPNAFAAIRLLGSINKVYSRGLSFKLVSDNWITKYRVRTFNDKEPEMLDWIDQYLLDDDVFFDVGANIGIYSIYAALRNSKISVYSFEPEYSNLNQLKQNILNNKLEKSILPYSIALGAHTGISFLNIQDLTPGAALHTVSNDSLKNTSTGHEVVWKEGIASYTIDDFCDATGIKPNLIKIDVDGNETEILIGGKNTFTDGRLRTIYIEIDSMQKNCEKILCDYGFILDKKPSENQIWIRK